MPGTITNRSYHAQFVSSTPMNCINLKIAAINVNSITSNHKRFELLEFNEIIKKRPELQPSASQNGNYDDSSVS